MAITPPSLRPPSIHRVPPPSWEWYNLGTSQLNMGNVGGALQTCDRILSGDPEFHPALALRALCLARQQKLKEAERAATRALQLAPDSHYALNAMGVVMVAGKKYKKADGFYKRLLEKAPNQSTYFRNAANLYRQTREPKMERQMLEKAVELSPENPIALSRLGDFFFRRGMIEKAEELSRESLNIQPDNLDGLVLAGQIALYRGEVEKARDYALWALHENAEYAPAIHLLVSIKARQSLLLGLWWRLNSWTRKKINSALGLFAIIGFFALLAVLDAWLPRFTRSHATDIDWLRNIYLGIMAYRIIGVLVFRKMLTRELKRVQLKRNF